VSKITSDDMRSILHSIMRRDIYYSANQICFTFRTAVEQIEATTNRRVRPCRDWVQRVAQLLCNDKCITIRPGERSWWYTTPNKYCLTVDENDIQFYIR